LQTGASYDEDIIAIRNIIKGNFKESLKLFKDLMMKFAD